MKQKLGQKLSRGLHLNATFIQIECWWNPSWMVSVIFLHPVLPCYVCQKLTTFTRTDVCSPKVLTHIITGIEIGKRPDELGIRDKNLTNQ
jgi:hypothetical protein